MVDQHEASRRRRIVAQGLKPHVSAATLQAAVKLCDKEFQGDGVFSVQRFLDRLAQLDTDVSAHKGVLFKSLINLRQVDPTQLGPDPLEGNGVRPPSTREMTISAMASANGKAAVAAGWSRMFQMLLKTYIGLLRNQDESRLASLATSLTESLDELKLSASSVLGLRSWIGSKFGTILNAVPMNIDEMQRLLHAIYVWCCEEFGPVASDRMMGRALKECESLPEAAHYPPQTFM